MEIKKQQPPRILARYDLLLECLPSTHPKRPAVQHDYFNHRAGYAGESQLPYYMQFLKEEPLILYQPRLENGQKRYFQMDAVVVTPHFLLITEVKNYKGELRLEPQFAQLIQSTKGEEKVYPCPIQQSRRQELQLKAWLTSNGFPSIPVYSHICIANDYSRITCDQPVPNFSHITKLPAVYQTLLEQNKRKYLAADKCRILAEKLAASHVPETGDLLKKYDLSPEELSLQVSCPSCEEGYIVRAFGRWSCCLCRTAHPETPQRLFRCYGLFISRTITVRQASRLLNISSLSTVRRILYPHVDKQSGKTKKSIYRWKEDLLS
jgi:hypothetical protein